MPVTAEMIPVNAGEMLSLAQRLIRIPSVNPPGDEAVVVAYLAEYLERAGLAVTVTEVQPGRPNLLATLEFGAGPTVLLNGHTDVVVPGEGWRGDPFSGDVQDAKLYGRGAADMKGPLAAMIEAMLTLKRCSRVRRGRVVLAAVMGEEYGGLGTKDLVRQKMRADHAIVGEPSELRPVIAHKGTVRYEIVVEGKAAHGSVPEAGVNAIYKMADVVAALRSRHAQLAATRHPLVGSPTLNVGTITGGLGTCIVPDRCAVTIDRRVVPGEPVETVGRELEEILGALRARDPELCATLSLQNIAPAMEISAEQPVVRAIREATAAVTGTDPGVHGWTATADSNLLVNELGIPTVIFGPGSIFGVAHQPNEYVAVADLVAAARIYSLSLMRLLQDE
jgi:acetylornithine deacetylase/succinyl-diaminopimelate desuccinylase family protein